MLEDYKNALKSGQRAYRACVARGQSPYLAVLDDILNGVNIVAQEPLGLVDIPAESIVGTKYFSELEENIQIEGIKKKAGGDEAEGRECHSQKEYVPF